MSNDLDQDIARLWADAVARFEARTKTSVSALGSITSIEQLIASLAYKKTIFTKRRRNGSKIERIRTLASKALLPISAISDVLSQATKLAYPPAEAIFGAVRYMIGIANAVSAGYDVLSEFLEDVDSYLHQLKCLGAYSESIPNVAELHAVLVSILGAILDLSAIWIKYMKSSRIAMTLMRLRGPDAELIGARQRFDKLVAREQGIKTNTILCGVDKTVALITKLEVSRGRADLTASFDRLSAVDMSAKHRLFHDMVCPGTCQWILDSPQYKSWYTDAHSAPFWLNGIGGSGKSVFCARAIEDVRQNSTGSSFALAHIYIHYKESVAHTESAITLSLARQVAEQCSNVPDEVIAFYEKYTGKKTSSTREERIALLRKLASRFQTVYIFIDALDECPEHFRYAVISMLHEVASFTRLFMTSRPHLLLNDHFSDLRSLKLLARSSDVRKSVVSAVDSNHRLSIVFKDDSKLRRDIITALVGNANGLFLLSKLQLVHICGLSNIASMRKALNTLPSTLETMYEKALDTIDGQTDDSKETAWKALSFLACAKRPLALNELLHALGVSLDHLDLDLKACPPRAILLEISAGLIEADATNNTVSLAHYTIQQHIETNLPAVIRQGHYDLGQASLAYLGYGVASSRRLEGNITRRLDTDIISRLSKYSFLEYAAQNCGYHLSKSERQDWSMRLLETISQKEKLEAIVEVIYAPRRLSKPLSSLHSYLTRFPENFTIAHLLAFWGLCPQLAESIDDGCDVNSQDSNGVTILHLAAIAGYSDVVHLAIERGADIDKVNSKKQNAAYLASRNGHAETLRLLLAKGARLETPDLDGHTALDWAIVNGHRSILEMILGNSDSSRQMQDEAKNRALALAAEAGKGDMILSLLDNGASVDWQDAIGSTALGWAVAEGHLAAVKIMLDHGADVNLTDDYLNTPLHWAIPFPAIISLFVDHGAELNAQNNTGQTPLMWAVQDGHVDGVNLLLSLGAEVDLQDKHGFTALHAASLKGYIAIVKTLLDHGASTTIEDEDGWTALHAAAIENQDHVIAHLRDRTPDSVAIIDQVAATCNDKNEHMMQRHLANKKSEGSTACTGLRWVVQLGQVDRIQAILNTGVNIDAADVGGSTALTLATWLRQNHAVQLLLEYGADPNIPGRDGKTALHLAAEDTTNQEAIVQHLLQWGATVDASAYSFTPILLAAIQNHPSIVDLLIGRGANVKATDYHGRTALHYLAQHGNTPSMVTLLSHGADVNASDRLGKTPLMLAIDSRSPDVLRALIKGGADINITDKGGSTALHLAVDANEVGLVRELLDNGAMDDARNLEGMTALHIALFHGSTKMVNVLAG